MEVILYHLKSLLGWEKGSPQRSFCQWSQHGRGSSGVTLVPNQKESLSNAVPELEGAVGLVWQGEQTGVGYCWEFQGSAIMFIFMYPLFCFCYCSFSSLTAVSSKLFLSQPMTFIFYASSSPLQSATEERVRGMVEGEKCVAWSNFRENTTLENIIPKP